MRSSARARAALTLTAPVARTRRVDHRDADALDRKARARPPLGAGRPHADGTGARKRVRDRDAGAGGRLLARYPFQPQEQSDPPGPATANALIHEVVPFPAGTRRIVITHATKTLASVLVSAHAPTVRLISPNGGKALRRTRVTVRWRSRDADGNRRWYTVLYSPDGQHVHPGGHRAHPHVAPGRPDNASRRPACTVRGDRERRRPHRQRPLRPAVRGTGEAAAGLDRRARQEQTQLVAGQQIAFVGTATDLQDGQLPASQLVWSSSLQGTSAPGRRSRPRCGQART